MFITIIVMMAVGGIIGGFTNYLAIKMLFRPYRTLYIGKWRVPFTPGLIPKRRNELAEQLGKMVVGHLLTPESLKKKFSQPEFRADVIDLFKTETSKLLNSEKTLSEIVENLGIQNGNESIKRELDHFIEKTYQRISEKYRDQPVKLLITSDFKEKVEAKIPVVSQYIIEKGVEYFSSIEGKTRIQRMFDDFLKERGMLGNMVQMFLGNVSLADKMQPELIKFLNSEGTSDLLNTLLSKEWSKVTEWKLEEIEDLFEKEKILLSIKQYSKQIIRIDQYMDMSILTLLGNYHPFIIEKMIPKIVTIFGDSLSGRVEMIFEKLHLEKLVSEQVETFSLQRLEELVLSITSSELKMITYLGVLLGALIGFFQGLFAIFF